MNEEIRIPLDKSKMLFSVCATMIFTLLNGFIIFAILFLNKNPNQPNLAIAIISSFGIIIFGSLSIIGLKRILSKKYSLIINEIGITDNISISNFGQINWNEIADIKTVEIVAPKMRTTTLLLIFLKNPKPYLEKANMINCFFMKINHKKYGTPLTINISNLDYNLNNIESFIKLRFEKFSA